MPSSLKRAEEYGDDLTVLFVEVSKKSLDEVEAFAYSKRWMGTSATWTDEKPFSSGFRTIPSFVLLSSEGEVLLKGNPMRLKKQLDETIQAQIALATEPPQDHPRSLKKSWSELAKGRYGKAIDEATQVRDKGDEDAGAASALLERIERELQGEMQDVRWSIEHGYLVEAQERCDELARALEKSEPHAQQLAALEAALEEQPADEQKAARALAKVQKKLYEDGLKDKLVKELERIAKRYPETKSGARAGHLARLGS